MTYILVVVLIIMRGAAMTSVELPTLAACEAAGKQLVEEMKFEGYYARFFCIRREVQ